MTRYKDLFIDFDDTIYDTHGNAQLSLEETYAHFGLPGPRSSTSPIGKQTRPCGPNMLGER